MNNIETWHIWKVVLYTYIFGERVYYFINGAWDSVITLIKKLKTKSLLHTIQNNSKKNKDHYVKCKTFKLWPSLWPLDTGGFFFKKKTSRCGWDLATTQACDWELNRRPFGSQDGIQSTKPHQPGPGKFFKYIKYIRAQLIKVVKI